MTKASTYVAWTEAVLAILVCLVIAGGSRGCDGQATSRLAASLATKADLAVSGR